MRVATDPGIAADAREIAERACDGELQAIVDVSSPSGDVAGAEAAITVCAELLPDDIRIERPDCSTEGCAPDLVARLRGSGSGRIVLLGHVDTVFAHAEHAPLRDAGERLHGSGTIDMKGGDILALGVARSLARTPEDFAELAVVMVCDEEWRVSPFRRVAEFAGYDACLCFEAGHLTPEGQEGIVVRRKAAGTLLVDATGRAAHSGAAPDQGRNALLALARVADAAARFHDPAGEEQLSVVPTVMRSGEAFNVVPASGELICDMRARRLSAFDPVLESVPAELDEVALAVRMGRSWPGMDAEAASAELLRRTAQLTPRPEARDGLALLLAIVGSMWVVEAINSVDGNALDRAGGIYPRNVDHLWAIFTSPFLHENFYPHLFDNTLPLVFMGVIIALRGARRLALVTLIVIVIGGLGTWLISPGREYTIGASGLVFGYATYLFARGVFNHNLIEIGVGLVVGVVWGAALISSVVPHAGVSWEAHVCGAVGGVVAAWLLATPHGRTGRDPDAGPGGPPARTPPAPRGGPDLHSALDRALS